VPEIAYHQAWQSLKITLPAVSVLVETETKLQRSEKLSNLSEFGLTIPTREAGRRLAMFSPLFNALFLLNKRPRKTRGHASPQLSLQKQV
jgi:hypothetical protein